jgi:hypothetical protein
MTARCGEAMRPAAIALTLVGPRQPFVDKSDVGPG